MHVFLYIALLKTQVVSEQNDIMNHATTFPAIQVSALFGAASLASIQGAAAAYCRHPNAPNPSYPSSNPRPSPPPASTQPGFTQASPTPPNPRAFSFGTALLFAEHGPGEQTPSAPSMRHVEAAWGQSPMLAPVHSLSFDRHLTNPFQDRPQRPQSSGRISSGTLSSNRVVPITSSSSGGSQSQSQLVQLMNLGSNSQTPEVVPLGSVTSTPTIPRSTPEAPFHPSFVRSKPVSQTASLQLAAQTSKHPSVAQPAPVPLPGSGSWKIGTVSLRTPSQTSDDVSQQGPARLPPHSHVTGIHAQVSYKGWVGRKVEAAITNPPGEPEERGGWLRKLVSKTVLRHLFSKPAGVLVPEAILQGTDQEPSVYIDFHE